MRGENNRQIENLCDNLPYLFRIGKAKDKRSLLRCRFNYVSSSLLETWRLQRPKKNENLEKCIGRREAQHRRWFRGCVNVSERRSPCQGCLLCPRNVGSGGTPERKKWGLEQVPFFCLCSTALTTSFPSRALFSWELGTTRFRLRPRGLTFGIINAQEETGSERQWNIKKSRSNRGMPAVQEHLNGATGRTSIARCGLPCCRSESRRRGSRFEEAVVDWKSYMLPVEWTISLSLLHCERLFCCPFSFLSLPLFQLWADARLGVLARDSCCCTHCSLSFLEFRVPSFFL
ncbi:uncharacterized protein LOC107996965 [Apis cerana]|uniref:uncharacterized protein LOC107996965 n=1 Tax=Apis cerana TaxID=7461 RepID=UPI002B239CCB|nr:uncharacterized protein LOC107996965 [Apis cerana]